MIALDLTASGDPGEYTCSVPAGITVLQRLQHLGLRHCVAGPLPRSMRQMTQLTSLDVMQQEYDFEALLFRDADGLVVSLVLCDEMACVHTYSRYSCTARSRLWLSCLLCVPEGDAGQHCRASVHHLLSLMRLQPLPPSLQALDACAAYADSLYELTALKRLSLDGIVEYKSSRKTIDLSMLVQLTFLQLHYAGDSQLTALKGCTGLRTLYLSSACTLHVLSCTLLEHSLLKRLQWAARWHTG